MEARGRGWERAWTRKTSRPTTEETRNTEHKPPTEPQEAGRTHASSSPRRVNTFSAYFFILYFQISAAHRCACEVKSQFQFHVAVLSGQKRKMEKTAAFPEKTSDFDATPPSHAHGHARQHHEKATLHATSVHNTSGTDVFVFQRDHRNKRVYLGRKKQISSNQRRKKGGETFFTLTSQC